MLLLKLRYQVAAAALHVFGLGANACSCSRRGGSRHPVFERLAAESFSRMMRLTDWGIAPSSTYDVRIEGYCEITGKFVATADILDRLSRTRIVCVDGKSYKLLGPFDRVSGEEGNIPSRILDAFVHGVPRNWKQVIRGWSEQESKANGQGSREAESTSKHPDHPPQRCSADGRFQKAQGDGASNFQQHGHQQQSRATFAWVPSLTKQQSTLKSGADIAGSRVAESTSKHRDHPPQRCSADGRFQKAQGDGASNFQQHEHQRQSRATFAWVPSLTKQQSTLKSGADIAGSRVAESTSKHRDHPPQRCSADGRFQKAQGDGASNFQQHGHQQQSRATFAWVPSLTKQQSPLKSGADIAGSRVAESTSKQPDHPPQRSSDERFQELQRDCQFNFRPRTHKRKSRTL
ncbi:uncharacterized protein LOC125942718 [Dermacentor silvarum]|uniref:uncharacterized protein LOC125942718 n=1 Tax=Dermacentor silvarum TaxID=543639 RepID=UPI0021011500|nr:uncharacterized protein LOC125942718 [Dermacentor silvarum]